MSILLEMAPEFKADAALGRAVSELTVSALRSWASGILAFVSRFTEGSVMRQRSSVSRSASSAL